jgi:hypothetical protein
MASGQRLPDQAWVVRCGLPPFANSPLLKACGWHPDGPYGFSVQAAADLTIEQLAARCRNNSVGVTTVGEIRSKGYEIVPTRGEGWHATVVVPENLGSEAANELTCLFTKVKNPAPKRSP